jgi:hypothetical protein
LATPGIKTENSVRLVLAQTPDRLRVCPVRPIASYKVASVMDYNAFMPFTLMAEKRIRAAVEQGEFQSLPGAGKPLNIEEYFSAPPDMRMAFSILKNANCVPAEVELLNEVSRLQQAIASAPDVVQRRELQRALVNSQTQLAIVLERRSSRNQ